MPFSSESEIYRRYRLKEQLFDWFEPFPYQIEAYYSDKPIQLIEGGNRSGKTHLAIAKLVAIAIGKHPTIIMPPPLKIRIIATVLREGAQGIILDKLKELLPTVYLHGLSWNNAYKTLDSLINLRNKSVIQLMADSQDIQTHRGSAQDIILIDEECQEKVFDESLTRLADRSGMLLLSMTPHNGMTWSYKKLVKASRTNDRIGYFHLDTLSNYKINRKDWIKNSALLSNKEFDIRVKGIRVANEGLVYFMVTDQTHAIRAFNIPATSNLYLGVDFGLNNPHAGSLWAITPDKKKYIIDEYYEVNKTVAQNGEKMGNWIKNKWGGYKLRWIACDPNSGSKRNEQTNETNVKVFKKAFCQAYEKNIPILLGNRSHGCLEHRINVMRELLTLNNSGMPELMIFSNCVKHFNEFEDYAWHVRKDENLNAFERPREAHNHLMNACEYIAERNPRYISNIDYDYIRPNIELQYGHIGR